MKTCASCGATMTAEANYCSRCGAPPGPEPAGAVAPAIKWYYNVWFVLFMLFFVLGPFGLPLVWKHPRFSRWVKIALTALMCLYTAVLAELTVRMTKAVLDNMHQFQSTLGW